MTNQEILTKAIEKAIANGWEPTWVGFDWAFDKESEMFPMYWKAKEPVLSFKYETLIFNHDFAKALWGEGKTWVPSYKRRYGELPPSTTKGFWRKGGRNNWEYHLAKMVIAPDPIKYLESHVD